MTVAAPPARLHFAPRKIVVLGPHSVARNRACFRAMDHAWSPLNGVRGEQGIQVVTTKDRRGRRLELWDVTGPPNHDGLWATYAVGATTVILVVPATSDADALRDLVRDYRSAARRAAPHADVRLLVFDETEPTRILETELRRLLRDA